jgi:prepilin-type N-terminal cleavage/methylation domain-containing protein
MQRRRGFTLIEILVTIAIMVILMGLAVANIRSTQIRARDDERKNDAENMARQLDSSYTTGFSFTFSGSPVTFIGSYPTTAHMADPDTLKEIFDVLPPDVIIAPGKSTADDSVFVATNASEDPTLVTPTPSASNPYVYQPMSITSGASGFLCTDSATQTCRRFNLYYWTEADNVSHMIKGINR